jgi:TolA-binding protein
MRGSRFRVLPVVASLLVTTVSAFGQPPPPKPDPLSDVPKLEPPKILSFGGGSPDLSDSTYVRVRNERALFDRARSYFDERSYGSAASTLREFLDLYPRSLLAAEATYRLSLADLFLERADEARKLQEQLVRDYPTSPWAQLVVTAHFTLEQLQKLADEKRSRARENPHEAVDAAEVYKLILQRFSKDVESKEEITYRLAVCAELYGATSEARKLFEQLIADQKDKVWGKLSSFRTGDAAQFQAGMVELCSLNASGEEAYAFLDLADRFESGLGEDDRVHCEFLRGKCLDKLHRSDQAVAVWSKTIADHPESARAPECLFWMAEHHYCRKEIGRAAEEYRTLLQKYPGSARAAVARRWAEELPDYDAVWSDLERCVTIAGKKLTAGQTVFSAELGCKLGDDGPSIRGRIAHRDRSHYRFEISVNDGVFLLLANDEGGWFRAPGEPCVVTTPVGAIFPLPQMKLGFNPATGKSTFFFGSVDGEGGPLLEFSPEFFAANLTDLQTMFHIRRFTRKDGETNRVVYALERLCGDAVEPDACEVEADADGTIRAVRWSCMIDGKVFVCSLSDIRIAEPLPADIFAIRIPKGFAKREAESLSIADVFESCAKFVHTYRSAAPTLGELRDRLR